jgi:GDSL-like lipase/acylhydrolase family protein
MKRFQWSALRSLCTGLVALAFLATLHGQAPASNAHRIAIFGSSVANGTGDELGKEGYTGRLRAMLAPLGWEVLNQSRGGDNTVTMAPRFAPEGAPAPNTRYLLPVNPHYVVLGLSLGNEGIANVKTKEEKDAVFKQFESGMKGFIARSREHHIVPVVTTCYTRMDFTEVEYEYTRRMNLLIDSWDVPSVNFLGAVDDGTGKWARGFWYDSLHPNANRSRPGRKRPDSPACRRHRNRSSLPPPSPCIRLPWCCARAASLTA